MCIAIPSRVVELRDHTAVVECYSVQREASLLLMPAGTVEVGDYVILQTGFVIEKVDAQAAREAMKLFDAILAVGPHAED